jgi:hypothetical protein
VLTRRALSAGLALSACGLILPRARPALALDWAPYEREPIERAHAQATPIVVAVYGTGCAACAAQAGLLDEVLSEHTFVMFLRFRLDFDRQRDFAAELKVDEPGAVLAYVCYEEIGRLAGTIDAGALRKLLWKTQAA